MSEKALAYLVTVDHTEPIPEKDRIVNIFFKGTGWSVIGSKDTKPENRFLYFEVDSIIDAKFGDEVFYSRTWSDKYKGCVIRTMKMAGQISNGYAIQVPSAYEYVDKKGIKKVIDLNTYKDGDDLTEFLNVRRKEDVNEESNISQKPKTKWQYFCYKYLYKWFPFLKPIKTKGSFPSQYVGQTDETQSQSLGYIFEKFRGKKVYTTVKMDGQSATFIHDKGRFWICSRKLTIWTGKIKDAIKLYHPGQEHKYNTSWEKVACKYDIPNKLKEYPLVIMAGEACGPGVQKNKLQLKEPELYIFNVTFEKSVANKFLAWNKLEAFCKANGFLTVPLIENDKIFEFSNIQELEDYAQGDYPCGGPREGVVFRAYDESTGYNLPPERGMCMQASWKIINPKFRIKYSLDD
jgi:hypothetical protein